MPFPIQPDAGDDEGQFLVQDPFDLRRRVLPLFAIERANGNLTGLGTAFQVDLFGTLLTAEHVLQEHTALPDDSNPHVAAVLFGMGLAIGRVSMPSSYFAPLRRTQAWRRLHEEPSPLLFGGPQAKSIVIDLMQFQVDASAVPGKAAPNPLPLRLSGRRPNEGPPDFGPAGR